MTYLWRRLFASMMQVAAASLFAFLLFSVAPGDFYSGESFNPQRSSRALEQMRQQSGLRDPWFRRYGAWVASCARGEFGVSLGYGMPVGRLIAPRARATLSVAVPAFVLAWLAGLLLALAAQRWPGLVRTPLESVASSAGLVPDVIAVSLLVWLAVRFGLPISGPALPIVSLTLSILPVVFLHAASSLSAARELWFVRMAQRRGLAGWRLWLVYILPAAANPLVSLFGLSMAATIGASLLVEVLTGWPGVGPLFLEAVQARDYPIVQSVILLLALILTASNLLGDLLLYRLDPRIRTPA